MSCWGCRNCNQNKYPGCFLNDVSVSEKIYAIYTLRKSPQVAEEFWCYFSKYFDEIDCNLIYEKMLRKVSMRLKPTTLFLYPVSGLAENFACFVISESPRIWWANIAGFKAWSQYRQRVAFKLRPDNSFSHSKCRDLCWASCWARTTG